APAGDPSAGDWYYEITELGMNYRITDVQCALGTSQLAKLERFVARRGEIAARYLELFADSDIELQLEAGPPLRNAHHLFVALLAEGVDRKVVFDALRADGIGVQVHFIPIYWHPYYSRLGFARGICPETERAYNRCLSLPVFPGMSNGDVERSAAALLRE